MLLINLDSVGVRFRGVGCRAVNLIDTKGHFGCGKQSQSARVKKNPNSMLESIT